MLLKNLTHYWMDAFFDFLKGDQSKFINPISGFPSANLRKAFLYCQLSLLFFSRYFT